MGKRLFIKKLLVILTLMILSITYSSYSYALEFPQRLFDWDVIDHIKAHATTLGIAVETYVNGEFREDAGVLIITSTSLPWSTSPRATLPWTPEPRPLAARADMILAAEPLRPQRRAQCAAS